MLSLLEVPLLRALRRWAEAGAAAAAREGEGVINNRGAARPAVQTVTRDVPRERGGGLQTLLPPTQAQLGLTDPSGAADPIHNWCACQSPPFPPAVPAHASIQTAPLEPPFRPFLHQSITY